MKEFGIVQSIKGMKKELHPLVEIIVIIGSKERIILISVEFRYF